jgi:hypothetical protein
MTAPSLLSSPAGPGGAWLDARVPGLVRSLTDLVRTTASDLVDRLVPPAVAFVVDGRSRGSAGAEFPSDWLDTDVGRQAHLTQSDVAARNGTGTV